MTAEGKKGVQKNKQTKRKPKMTAGLQEWFRRQTFIGWLACEKNPKLNQLEALLACSKPVCMRRKSRSLHSQAFSWRSRSDPSRSPGPSFRTWGCSSNTRCSASCTRVAKWTARPSRLTTRRETQWEGECQQIILVSKQEAFYHMRLFYCQTKSQKIILDKPMQSLSIYLSGAGFPTKIQWENSVNKNRG